MASSGGSPCGACKFLRRKCAADCVFAPYFCTEDGAAQFAAIHKVFGASNAAKLLHMAPPADRSEAAATVTYEAQARLRDPVYGCVAHIFALQQQVASLQMQLVQAKAHAAQRVAGAQAMGNPSLQPWQMDGPESLSTQSSGCYSAGPSGDHGVLQEMYCFSEQEDGNYTR